MVTRRKPFLFNANAAQIFAGYVAGENVPISTVKENKAFENVNVLKWIEKYGTDTNP